MSLTRALFVAAIISVVATDAPAQKPPAPTGPKAPAASRPQGIASSREIMEALTIPLSDAVFAAGSEAPKTDAQWLTVERQALALAESANLLLMAPRLVTSGSWVTWSVAQRDAAVVAMKAARAKNAEALATAGDALYETCAGCHKTYLPSK
jgi:hypothetical protein